MNNRYIPQQDGTYLKNRIPTPPPNQPPKPEPQAPTPCIEQQPAYHKPEGAFTFLQQLLPKNLDTADLLVIILLLLMAGDGNENKNSMLLTLALYLFL